MRSGNGTDYELPDHRKPAVAESRKPGCGFYRETAEEPGTRLLRYSGGGAGLLAVAADVDRAKRSRRVIFPETGAYYGREYLSRESSLGHRCVQRTRVTWNPRRVVRPRPERISLRQVLTPTTFSLGVLMFLSHLAVRDPPAAFRALISDL